VRVAKIRAIVLVIFEGISFGLDLKIILAKNKLNFKESFPQPSSFL
jgi:hypothetical protein